MKKIALTIITIALTTHLFAQNWVLKNSNTTDDIVDMYFKDEAFGFFLTNTGKLYKTTDSGENWNFIFQDNDFVDTLDPNYPIKNLELVTTYDSIFCYSSNKAGPNTLTIRLSSSLTNINFIKDTLNYKVTQPQFWNNEIWSVEKVNQKLGMANAVEEYNINGNYISASGPSHIYYSSDFGNTWNTNQFTNSPLNSRPFQSFYNGTDTLVAVTNYPTVLHKSFDNGNTWNSINPINGIKFNFLNINNYLAYNFFGNSTKVYSTNSGGNSFNEELLINVINGIYSFSNNYNNIYIFGKSGMLYKSTNGGGLLSSSIVNSKKKVINVYPNPTGDYLMIKSESNLILQKIVIYDNLGKVVFEDEKNNYKIDISNLTLGSYFVTLIFKNNEKTTLVFIKI